MSDATPKLSGDCITDRLRQNRAKAKAESELPPAPGSARTWLAGMALNGLLHSAAYGGELKRIFDRDSQISDGGDDRETPQHYTARIALSLADAMLEALQEPNAQAHTPRANDD